MKKVSAAPVRILLADDNKHGLVARRMILEDQGHEVDTACNGAEAWEKVEQAASRKQPFDIVVTDFRMGEIDGIELIRRIRAMDCPAPATPTRTILLSGFTDCLGVTEAETGADEVIAKTNKEVQELLRAVRKLGHHPPRRRPPASAKSAPVSARKIETA